jgi:hypothetical protein
VCSEPLPPEALAGLPPPRTMHLLLQRERGLCGRGRPDFAVVVFAVEDPLVDSGPALRLLQSFRHRARNCDTIGWLGRTHIALLLPATSPSGANQMATELGAMLSDHGDQPVFRVLRM